MPMEPLESELALELEPAALMDMPLRVWAEIGRVRMPAAFVVGMPHGAIVDLDSDPDEPADLFVNGRHYGTGRLILVEGEWALRVESLDAEPGVVASPEGGGAGVEQTSSSDQEQPPAAD
jgi:flagellar motor switch protein FliN/FliY